VQGVMKKCTLCVDRIDNRNLPEAERQPACVMACPTRARHFGDLGDADSAVSRLVAERGCVDLLPELGYRPVNRYLPPRESVSLVGLLEARAEAEPVAAPSGTANRLFHWLDRVLSL
jgi:Fe-S-cluster-containing dehydrogenase component